ncbi:MAG: hypothetical protein ACJ8J0_18575 [Longimicrobiaceae bacterium]
MKKLRLEIETLRVESFAMADDSVHPGTVAAHSDLEQDYGSGGDWEYGGGMNSVGTCIGPTYCCPVSWKPSCNSCVGTCGASCGGTCVYTCRPGDVCSL